MLLKPTVSCRTLFDAVFRIRYEVDKSLNVIFVTTFEYFYALRKALGIIKRLKSISIENKDNNIIILQQALFYNKLNTDQKTKLIHSPINSKPMPNHPANYPKQLQNYELFLTV